MLGMTVKEAKAGFFNADMIEKAADRAALRALSASAAYVATVARRSMKKARQKKIGDLTPTELKIYRRETARWKRGERSTKPTRPLLPSKPGEPPRTRAGHIRQYLYFAYDAKTGAAVAGPARFAAQDGGGKTPGALEQGGTAQIGRRTITIARRPYMQPALAAEVTKTAARFANSIK